MQATTAVPQASTPALARDLHAVIAYVMKSSGHEYLRLVDELELTISNLKALIILEAHEGELTVKDLAAALTLSLPATSRSVEALHARGFVERREDEQDRRMKQVRITPSGAAVLARINDSRISGVERFVESLSDAQRRRLAAALAPLLERDEVGACRRTITTRDR